MKIKISLTIAVFCLLGKVTHAQKLVPLNELANYVGDSITICDSVINTVVVEIKSYGIESYRNSVGLNLEGKGCPGKLSVSIDNRRVKFPFKPEEEFKNSRICVTGVLKKIERWQLYTIEVTEPKQIQYLDK